MVENTDFGNFVADGFISEIFVANDQNRSWAGKFLEDDLFVSEDKKFVTIAVEPMEEATEINKFLDVAKILELLLLGYIHYDGSVAIMPPYLAELIIRIEDLGNQVEKKKELANQVGKRKESANQARKKKRIGNQPLDYKKSSLFHGA
jgi:hypothetical protein